MKETAMGNHGRKSLASLVEDLRKVEYSDSAILEFVGKEYPEVSELINELLDSGYTNEAIINLLISKPVPTTPVQQQTANGKEVISEQELMVRVTKILLELGIPASLKGYQFVRTAIMMTVKDASMLDSVTKILYPTVAKRHSSTASRVERAIRFAIETAWDRGDVDVLDKYFGYTIQQKRGKPTNSEFIAMLADKLRLEYSIKE